VEQDIRLGKIAGIPVGINWSMLVIFVLFAWEISDLVLPAYHPHDATATYWIVGIATTIVFFASLMFHEISHAVVARRNGIGVRAITFWLFGGVSELESEALSPGVEFRVAVVGPLTSCALAGLFGLSVLLLHHGGIHDVVVSALGWLAWMNLLLGGFNLIPASPLDGGRVLRAIVWRRTGDRARATATASRAGEAFGYVLIVLGVLEFLAVGIVGLWFVFVGWFVLTAARAEESSSFLRTALAKVNVGDIMTKDPVTFTSTMTVADLVDNQMHNHHFGTFPLVGPNGELAGLTSMGRIRHVAPDLRSTTRLIDIACPLAQVPTGTPDEPVTALLQRMQSSPDGRAFVIDAGGHLVGVVSPSDIARYVQWRSLKSRGQAVSRN